MTTFFLIRHGSNDYFTHTLVGRKPGIRLNDTGHREAHRIAARMAGEDIQHIYSSPLERCRETAEPLAGKIGLEIHYADELLEVDFGDWTGKTFAELDTTEPWKQWNCFRSAGRAPHGEAMIEVQSRVVGFIQQLHERYPDGRIALFSHGDPLRAALIYYLGTSLEFIRRLELSPGSVTILEISQWDAKVQCLNWR